MLLVGKGKKIDVSGKVTNKPWVDNPFDKLDVSNLSQKKGNFPTIPCQVDPQKTADYFSAVNIRRQKAGRGGKTVTTIHFDSPVPKHKMESLLYEIKKKWACGGVIRTDFIEIQGDIRQSVADFFRKKGANIKFCGG